MKSTQFQRSAALLVGGGVTAAVGGLLVVLSLVVGGDTGANAALVTLGLLVGAVGVCVLLGGLWQLATNVDLAAKVASGILAREESEARAAGRSR